MPLNGDIGIISSFKKKSFTFALINYICIVNICLINDGSASSRVCRKLKHGLEDSLRYEDVQDIEGRQCPPSSSPFSVYKVAPRNSSSSDKEFELLVCWVKDIKRFALQFANSVQIHDVISVPGIQTRTCSNNNDSVQYHRKHKYDPSFRVLLTVPSTNCVPFVFRAYYSHKSNGTYYGHHRVLQYRYNGGAKLHQRRRRSLASPPPITTSKECGTTRNCYRNGGEGCNHFGCTYFLSYNTTDNKLIDIELSAKTNGWVAVGFSSDTEMGGDEVIVCKRTRTDEVVSGSYKNIYSHQDPKAMEGENILTLKNFQIKDGYIYCHVTRPMSVHRSNYQDLSNDWHQLYAYGPISSSGELEKHTQIPKVSGKISMVSQSNVLISGSVKTGSFSFFVFIAFLVSSFMSVRLSCV